MAWYDEAIFYHIYPLGMTGAPALNDYKYTAWVKNSTYDISIIKEFLYRYLSFHLRYK